MNDTLNNPIPYMDLDVEEYGQRLESFITHEMVSEILALVGMKEEAQIAQLKDGIFRAYDAYIHGQFDHDNQRSEKEENDALERVTQSAQVLYDDLLNLCDFPGLEPRIEQSIKTCPNLLQLSHGVDLSNIIGSKRNIFRNLREVLVDLQVCTENTMNKAPKRAVIESDLDASPPIFIETEEEYGARKVKWRARSKRRKFPRDYALQEFIASFGPTWQNLSNAPYSEGMYYTEASQTFSEAIDCLEIILRDFAPKICRQNLVTSFRNLRNRQKAEIPS